MFSVEEIFSTNALAESYRADGRMTYAVRDAQGNLDVKDVFSFTIWVDDCKWFIQTSDEGRKDIKSFEDSYDGKYVYALSTFIDKTGTDQSSGIIENNNIPQENSFYASPVWLALASSCYFNDITNDMFQPIWHLSDISIRNKRFSIVGHWTKHNASPFLPEKVSYYNDGKIYYTDSGGNSRIASYASPYDKGFMEAEYIALEYTNKYEITLPRQFTFTRYMPRPGGQSTNETMIMCLYSGVVTNISIENKKTDYWPALSPPVYIDDRRFGVVIPPVTSIQYMATNSWWPSMENPVVTNKYKVKAFGANASDFVQSSPKKPLPKLIIWGALLCTTLFFVFLLFKGTRKN